MQAYGDLPDRSLSTIRTNPNIGHVHPVVRDPHKCFQAGRHLIFYRLQDVTVFVVRILLVAWTQPAGSTSTTSPKSGCKQGI
jgi:toxin ParE1/3/4